MNDNERPEDKIWISKEEYQRLQSASVSTVKNLDNKEVAGSPPKLFSAIQIVTTTLAGLLFLGTLSFSMSGVFTGLILIPLVILLIQGYFLYSDYRAAHIPGGQITAHKERNKVMLIVTLAVFLAPIIFVVGIIIYFTLFPLDIGS